MGELIAFCNRVILSLAGFPIVGWLWFKYSRESLPMVLVVMGMPLVFGYVMPGIAILRLRLWEMHSKFAVNGFQVHQGFIYASGMALDAYVCHHLRFEQAWASVLFSCLLNGCIVGFTGWFFDIKGVEAGRIRIFNPMSALGKEPATVVTYYAPACYFVLGACFMLGVQIAWAVIVDRQHPEWAWGLFAGGLILTGAPAVAMYLRLQYPRA